MPTGRSSPWTDKELAIITQTAAKHCDDRAAYQAMAVKDVGLRPSLDEASRLMIAAHPEIGRVHSDGEIRHKFYQLGKALPNWVSWRPPRRDAKALRARARYAQDKADEAEKAEREQVAALAAIHIAAPTAQAEINFAGRREELIASVNAAFEKIAADLTQIAFEGDVGTRTLSRLRGLLAKYHTHMIAKLSGEGSIV